MMIYELYFRLDVHAGYYDGVWTMDSDEVKITVTPYLCSAETGDLNNDGFWNVLDIVEVANCVLDDNCPDLQYSCAADINWDGGYSVLDIVVLANCVLTDTCGG